MKFIVAITGASGALYAQRLLDHLRAQEVHLVLSDPAKEVAAEELDGGKLAVPDHVICHDNRSMRAPFVSGSAKFDAMIVIPCSMGTLGRIANGVSDDVICRAADGYSMTDVSSPALLREYKKVLNEYIGRTRRPMNHVRDFFDCIKSRRLTVANPEVMYRSMSICLAADICEQLKRNLKFDLLKSEFVGDAEANRMRSRAMREPWRI